MEPNLSSGLESKKASVYGRDYAKDLDAFYNDLALQQTFALFSHYEYIQNAKHLSDISGITELEAMDTLECLKNLSLLGVNENGYFGKSEKVKDIPNAENVRARGKRHSIKLMQFASQYTEAEKFCDDFLTISTSREYILEFYEKIAVAKAELTEKSLKLKPSERKKVLSFALAFLMDDINSLKGVNGE